MNLSDNQKKMDIVARLVKEGAIDFTEAIELLQEPEVSITVPWMQPNPYPVLPPWNTQPTYYTNNPFFTVTESHLSDSMAVILNETEARLYSKTPTKL